MWLLTACASVDLNVQHGPWVEVAWLVTSYIFGWETLHVHIYSCKCNNLSFSVSKQLRKRCMNQLPPHNSLEGSIPYKYQTVPVLWLHSLAGRRYCSQLGQPGWLEFAQEHRPQLCQLCPVMGGDVSLSWKCMELPYGISNSFVLRVSGSITDIWTT